MDLVTLLAAADGVHARDASTLARVDAFTASRAWRAPGGRRRVSHRTAAGVPVDVFPNARRVRGGDDVHDAPGGRRGHRARVSSARRRARGDRARPRARGTAKVSAGTRTRRAARWARRSGPGSDVSVVRSNRGGYQSYADLLDSDSDEEEAVDDAANAAA